MILILLVFSQLFATRYGGSGSEEARGVAQTPDGGFVMAGYTRSYGAGGDDILVIKTDVAGNLLWARAIGDTANDQAYAVAVTSDAGIAIAGYSYSSSSWHSAVLVKLDADGNFLWARRFYYSGTEYDDFYSLAVSSDGGFILGGRDLAAFGPGVHDLLLVKLNSTGGTVWSRGFRNDGWDDSWSIVPASGGDFVLVGRTEPPSTYDDDILVMRFSGATGALVWARIFRGDTTDWAWGVTGTPDGGFAVVGTSNSWGSSAMILKVNSDGSLSWARRVPGSSAYAVAVAGDGGIVVAGTGGFSLLKTDASGNLLWATRLANLTPRSLVILPDGQIAGTGTYSYDFCLFRVFSDGTYPNCFSVVTPATVDVMPVVNTSSSNPTASFVNVAWTPIVTPVNPNVVQVCSPIGVSEEPALPDEGIRAIGLRKAALFISPIACGISVYAADGRLAFSGNLSEGENRIRLGQGVYFWMAAGQRGKVAVME